MNKTEALNDFLNSLQQVALPENSPERVLEKILELTLGYCGWDLAAITKLDKYHKVAQIIAYRDEQGAQSSWSYDILGTPCFAVVESMNVVTYEDVQSQFADEIPLTDLGVKVYQGIMYFIAGQPVGHIFLMSKSAKTKQELEEATSVIRILSLMVGAYVDLVEKGEQVRHFQAKAETDQMTGLRNRHAFDEDISRVTTLYADSILADALLILIDIDGLKQTNDTQGHIAGDELIQAVARIIKTGSRQEDSVYRLGGDEFAVLIIGNSKKVNDHIQLKIADWRAAISAEVSQQAGISYGATLLSSCMVSENDQQVFIQSRFRMTDDLLYQDKLQKTKRLSTP